MLVKLAHGSSKYRVISFPLLAFGGIFYDQSGILYYGFLENRKKLF